MYYINYDRTPSCLRGTLILRFPAVECTKGFIFKRAQRSPALKSNDILASSRERLVKSVLCSTGFVRAEIREPYTIQIRVNVSLRQLRHWVYTLCDFVWRMIVFVFVGSARL